MHISSIGLLLCVTERKIINANQNIGDTRMMTTSQIKAMYATVASTITTYGAKRAAVIKLMDAAIYKHLKEIKKSRLGFGLSDIAEVIATFSDSDITITPFNVCDLQTRSELLMCKYKIVGGILIASAFGSNKNGLVTIPKVVTPKVIKPEVIQPKIIQPLPKPKYMGYRDDDPLYMEQAGFRASINRTFDGENLTFNLDDIDDVGVW